MRQDEETREVVLPISGQTALLREGDGYADRQLIKRDKDILDQVPLYLASLCISLGDFTKITEQTIRDLLLPDQEFLAIETFKLRYGDDFIYKNICGSCLHAEPLSVHLPDLDFRPLPEEFSGMFDPTVRVTLPRSGKQAEVGMLDGNKEAILNEQAATIGVVDPNQADYLSLRSLDGSRDFSYEDVINLRGRDHFVIRQAREQLICGYDTFVFATCSSCGAKRMFNLLLRRDFFLHGG